MVNVEVGIVATRHVNFQNIGIILGISFIENIMRRLSSRFCILDFATLLLEACHRHFRCVLPGILPTRRLLLIIIVMENRLESSRFFLAVLVTLHEA